MMVTEVTVRTSLDLSLNASEQLLMTHEIGRDGKEHTLNFYRPNSIQGTMAGKLILSLVCSAEQAKELKAHL